MSNFGVCQLRNPWVDFQKILHSWLRHDPTPHANIGVSRFKGGVSAHAWNCHPPASIFFFFKSSCVSLQVGPLDRSSSLTARMMRPRDHHVLFMVSLIRKYFPYFYPKMWKIALHPTWTLNSYNFGIVKDTYKLFAPNRGYSGSANLIVSFKLTPGQLLLPR